MEQKRAVRPAKLLFVPIKLHRRRSVHNVNDDNYGRSYLTFDMQANFSLYVCLYVNQHNTFFLSPPLVLLALIVSSWKFLFIDDISHLQAGIFLLCVFSKRNVGWLILRHREWIFARRKKLKEKRRDKNASGLNHVDKQLSLFFLPSPKYPLTWIIFYYDTSRFLRTFLVTLEISLAVEWYQKHNATWARACNCENSFNQILLVKCFVCKHNWFFTQ